MLARYSIVAFGLALSTHAHADTPGYTLLTEGLRRPDVTSSLTLKTGWEHAGQSADPVSWRDQGSARRLRGIVCVEHIFVSTPEARFSESQRALALEASRAGLRFVEKAARLRHIAVTFRERVSDYTSLEDIAGDSSAHTWTSAAVAASEPRLGLYLPIARCEREACEQHLAVLHLLRPGRSYALPSLFSRDREMERVVMYSRELAVSSDASLSEASARATLQVPERPASYVHELLHLFGAEDLYQPDARRRAAMRRYPNEVMLQSHRALADVEISEVTAYAIGWSDSPAPALD